MRYRATRHAIAAIGAAFLATAPGMPAIASTLQAKVKLNPDDGRSYADDRDISNAAPGDRAEFSNYDADNASSYDPDEEQLVLSDWFIEGSAWAEVDALGTSARWMQNRIEPDNSVEAGAKFGDDLTFAGDGRVEFTYTLSGLFTSSVTADSDVEKLDHIISGLSTDGLGVFFSASLGFGRTMAIVSDKLGPTDRDSTQFNWTDRWVDHEVTLSRDVSDGEVLDYWVNASSIIDIENVSGRVAADFDSTARLTGFSLTDGLTMTSESGFDYFSVNGGGDPSIDDGDPADPLPAVPLPAGLPLLLSGIGALAMVRRQRRSQDFERGISVGIFIDVAHESRRTINLAMP